MIESIGHSGKFEIYANGKLDSVIYNKIMNTVLDQFVSTFLGSAVDLQIKYLALGTDNTPITSTDTKLGAEIFRTPIVSLAKTATGEVTSEYLVLDSEAIGLIEEIGIFGGASATGVADSGTLISRILWSKDKTGSVELTIRRVDKVVGV